MKIESAIAISQDIPFGELKFKLSPEEGSLLKLISCEKKEALLHWEQLWKNTNDYEDLLFSCKELMPSAVKKIQTCSEEGKWQQFIPGNAQFLAGLPKYTWTKNQFIINQYQKIAAAMQKENIEFIALKGVCEMLDGNTLSFMRTSRDIDILIHEEDWNRCKFIFEKIGWIQSKKASQLGYFNSPIKPHAETFHTIERIFDLDVHFAAIPGAKSTSKKFTNNLWQRKTKSKNYPTLYIPSTEDRFIITVDNLFRLGNWMAGHTTKYLYDLHTISSNLDEAQIAKTIVDAERLMKLGKTVQQGIHIVKLIDSNKETQEKRKKYRFNYSVSQNFLIHITRLLFIIELAKLMNKREHVIHALTFFTSRVFLKIYRSLQITLFSKFKDSNNQEPSSCIHKNQFSLHLFPH